MRVIAVWIVLVMGAMLSASSVHGQDIAGDWQATLKDGNDLYRLSLHVKKNESGGWEAKIYSVDEGPDGFPVTNIIRQSSTIKFSTESWNASYEGKFAADGASVEGTWTEKGKSQRLVFQRATRESLWPLDPSSHKVSFITVDNNVKLEVLDWGGSGRALVLLAGLGNTGHVFDKFAPKLTANYHVYGITRRGFGESNVPTPVVVNYSADRLGDDVLAVIDTLKLNRPVLVGHSIAGEELSSIGTRHPEKVAGLIYLDAGYSYAYYDRSRGDLLLDSLETRKKLEQLMIGIGPQNPKEVIQELLQTGLPQLEKDLQERLKLLQAMPAQTQNPSPPMPLGEILNPAQAIRAGEQKYTDIRSPILAIFAFPHNLGSRFKDNPVARAAEEANENAETGAQVKAFERGLPSARVIQLPNADHFVFKSNEADILREMKAFLSSLP